MAVLSTLHINFKGNAREALEFYHAVFGGDLRLVTYEEMGNVPDPAMAQKVVWAQIVAQSGFRVMACDVPPARGWDRGIDPFSFALSCDTIEEATTYWEKLSGGATVVTDLAPARWAPAYGMLSDRFGVTWIVDVIAQH